MGQSKDREARKEVYGVRCSRKSKHRLPTTRPKCLGSADVIRLSLTSRSKSLTKSSPGSARSHAVEVSSGTGTPALQGTARIRSSANQRLEASMVGESQGLRGTFHAHEASKTPKFIALLRPNASSRRHGFHGMASSCGTSSWFFAPGLPNCWLSLLIPAIKTSLSGQEGGCSRDNNRGEHCEQHATRRRGVGMA